MAKQLNRAGAGSEKDKTGKQLITVQVRLSFCGELERAYRTVIFFCGKKVKDFWEQDDNKYSKNIQRKGGVKMRIVRTEKVQGIYGNQSLKRAETKTGASYGKDSVVFSNFARELQLASKAVREAPEVRADKVDQLRARIESGQYNVSASQIAEKILGF